MSAPSARSFRRLALLLAGVVLLGASACSSDDPAPEDAYKIGCPALDAALAGGSVLNRAAVKGLEAVRDSGQLDPDPTAWVETALGVLTASDPQDIPADARKILVDGCEEHGYPLKNLS